MRFRNRVARLVLSQPPSSPRGGIRGALPDKLPWVCKKQWLHLGLRFVTVATPLPPNLRHLLFTRPFLPTFFLPASPQAGRHWRSNRQFCNRFVKKQGVKCKKFPLNRSVFVQLFRRFADPAGPGRCVVRTFSAGCRRLRRPGDDVFNQLQQPLFSLSLLFDSQYPYPVFYIIITYPHSYIVDRIVIGH